VDLEQMKFIRSTYGLFFSKTVTNTCFILDQEIDKIQTTIKQLQKNFSELQYDLHLKECQTPNIYDSIECELIWKRYRTDDNQTSTVIDGNENDEEDLPDYSTSYEHCLLSFLGENDSLTSITNKDEKIILPTKKQTNNPTTILNNNPNKKRRICMSCGKC
jgi:hypothetical protein